MNGTAHVGTVTIAFGVPPQWQIASAADFNGDGQPDLLWQNTSTGERTIWFMNGPPHAGGVGLGSFAPQWRFAATGDFNNDGHPDLI